MKRAGLCSMLVVAGLAGCGYRARLDYTHAEQDTASGDHGSSHERRTSQQRLRVEVKADLDRETTTLTNVAEVVAAKQPTKSQPTPSAQTVTIISGGIHFHADTVIEPRRLETPFKVSSITERRDERCQRLQREHEERVADWLGRFR